jgi:DNA-directed RNA polymerase
MDLYQRQINIEQEYTNQGILLAIRKWEKDQAEGRLADTSIGRTITLRTYTAVVEELETLCSSGTRGVGGRYRSLLREVGLEECAVIGLRAALGLVGHSRVKAVVARNNRDRSGEPLAQDFISEVGTNLETEHMLKKLQVAAPGYMFRVMGSMAEARTRSVSHRRRTLQVSADNVKVGSENVSWSVTEREGVGRLVFEAVINAGVIETYNVPKSRGQSWVALRATEVIAEYIERMGNNLRAFVMYPPMLVAPREHSVDTLFSGASYITEGMAHLSGTVKMRSRRRDHRDWVRDNMDSTVLAAANKAAQQPYTIDTHTACLLRDLYREGVYNGVCGIPSKDPIEPPEYPLPADWSREDPELMEQHDAWKATARQSYADEIVRKSHVIEFNQTLKYLREYQGDTLYFPTYFDWRGRLYFRSRINPQSADFVKAVLQFANKKKLGVRGLYWLKGHVATCYGYDKKHPDARAVWADENIDLIRDAVANHVDSDFFRGADSPWCFYVAARELVAALDSGAPTEWESGIPVAMDATCSGMQHLSAILRDPVGGLFTNLVPNKGFEKEDIYAGVAAVALSCIQKDKEHLAQAQFWLNAGVFRADAKRPVMTYVYGGTLMSCTEYVFLSMQERALLGTGEFSQFKLASYLSRHLRNGIEMAVPSSAECMRYLRHLAGLMPDGEAMRWITPAGFPVLHHYPKEEVVRLKLNALGIDLNFTRFDDSQLNRAKCVNGIAPNFVHSLDSAHLVRVILAFAGCIVPIHDSFATHAADVDEMHRVLRHEFVDMYLVHDPLAVLTAVVQAYREEQIVMPQKGTLDIKQVRDSVFFMC